MDRTPAIRALCLAATATLAQAVSAAVIAVDDSDGAPTYTETGSWTTTSNTGAGVQRHPLPLHVRHPGAVDRDVATPISPRGGSTR